MIQLGLLGYTVITLEADKYGNGIHQQKVAAPDLPMFFKVSTTSDFDNSYRILNRYS